MDDGKSNELGLMLAWAVGKGRVASVKLDGNPDWVVVDQVANEPMCIGLIEARRASDGHMLIFSPARIVALDVGAGPLA